TRRSADLREIAEAAYRYQREIDENERVIVGVNRYVEEGDIRIPILKMDPHGYERQMARLEEVRQERDGEAVGAALRAVEDAARKERENLMPVFIDAVKAYATLGEIVDVLRGVFGTYREPTDWV